MKENEILEGNKLIAEFMGAVFAETQINIPSKDGQWYFIEDLKYNYSWDWLMPVVEKIKKYWFDDNCEAHKVCSLSIVTPIEEVWGVVVEFIKYYQNKAE